AGSSLAPARSRLWADDVRHPTVVFGLELSAAELERRIEERTRAMFELGVEEEVRGALAGGTVSATARQALGLAEVAELPREQAIEQLVLRTRRLAAYQRKWLRRIPGLVSVDGARPPHAIADGILEVARTR
ncbi:MAG: hypothetical protein H0T39_08195, partial [Actinobacteria bacterium]|nr:hypothetical protein [Actinomycetota bacterium]